MRVTRGAPIAEVIEALEASGYDEVDTFLFADPNTKKKEWIEVRLEISGDGSALMPEKVEQEVLRLAPFAVTGVFFATEYEGDEDRLYVGPEDQRAVVTSAAALEEITPLLEDFTPADRDNVYTQLAGPSGARPVLRQDPRGPRLLS